MLITYLRYTQGRTSKKEMKKANKQFREFLGALGLGIFVVLPFAPITIPALVRLGRKFKIEILPTSFRRDLSKSKVSKDDSNFYE